MIKKTSFLDSFDRQVFFCFFTFTANSIFSRVYSFIVLFPVNEKMTPMFIFPFIQHIINTRGSEYEHLQL